MFVHVCVWAGKIREQLFSVFQSKRLSGSRDVTPGMENVTQRLNTQTHTLTHSHTTERHAKGKYTKQTAHTEADKQKQRKT